MVQPTPAKRRSRGDCHLYLADADATGGTEVGFPKSRHSKSMNKDTAADGGPYERATNLPPKHDEKGEAAATASPMNVNHAAEHELTEHGDHSRSSAFVEPGVRPANDVLGNPDRVPADPIASRGSGKENPLPVSPAPLTGTPIPEMLQWLTDNRDDYEFYLLHSMFHDPLRRLSMIAVPLTPEDFERREEYSLVVRALLAATKIMGAIGQSLPCPPTEEFLRTYVDSAARIEGSDAESVADAMKLVRLLQDPKYSEQHYCVGPYFEAWYGAVRAKKAARELQKETIPDVRAILQVLETNLAAARQLDAALDDFEFDYNKVPQPPEPILKLGDDIIGTPGNIVNIQGPAKSAKSAVVCATIAATLADQSIPADTLGIVAVSPAGRAVVHFDTEQSIHAHYALVLRAHSRVQQDEKVPWLYSYRLAGREAAMCWDILVSKLQAAADAHGGIMLVVIDGIADFCNDPNNAEESFGLVRKLHKLALDYQCVVLTVLHENPGNGAGKTRGHLGSQLERKAETSLRLKKDAKTGITVMWADSARHCFIPQGAGWRFHWCDQAKMHVSLHERGKADEGYKLDKKAKFSNELSMIFREDETLAYGDLIARLTEATGLAESTAKSRIPEYKSHKLIMQDADEKYRKVRDIPPA